MIALPLLLTESKGESFLTPYYEKLVGFLETNPQKDADPHYHLRLQALAFLSVSDFKKSSKLKFKCSYQLVAPEASAPSKQIAVATLCVQMSLHIWGWQFAWPM